MSPVQKTTKSNSSTSQHSLVYQTPVKNLTEQLHRSDQQEFYQLLSYKDDASLEEKLEEWETFDDLARPHGTFGGKTRYEAFRKRL